MKTLPSYTAVALYLAEAASVQPSIALTADNSVAVAQIGESSAGCLLR